FTMCDKQQPRSGQGFPQPHVVQRSHDGLSRSRRCDQQIPMMALLPGKHNKLEQPLLKWLGAQLGRRENYGRPRIGPLFSTSAELLLIVRPQFWVVPVALENCSHLFDHISISSSRDADVPFEPADLSRMSQIGRSDIGRRESRLPMQ